MKAWFSKVKSIPVKICYHPRPALEGNFATFQLHWGSIQQYIKIKSFQGKMKKVDFQLFQLHNDFKLHRAVSRVCIGEKFRGTLVVKKIEKIFGVREV